MEVTVSQPEEKSPDLFSNPNTPPAQAKEPLIESNESKDTEKHIEMPLDFPKETEFLDNQGPSSSRIEQDEPPKEPAILEPQ